MRTYRASLAPLSDPQILKDETLNILIAGRDTTAAALTFAVYSLARHPDVLRRLRREVLDCVGTVRRLEYEDFKKMKYLRAVINETLRLYPPVYVCIFLFELALLTRCRLYSPLNMKCALTTLLRKTGADLQ